MKNKIHPGYKTLVKEVLPQLKGYTTDITVVDKARLTGYEGNFILGYRDSGTNLYRLDALEDAVNWKKEDLWDSLAKNQECSMAFLLNNTSFLYVDKKGESFFISKKEAAEYLEKRRDKAIDVIKFFENINIKQIAFELMLFIKHNGKNWKSRLKDEWNSYNSFAALRRLRNHFNHESIFKNISKKDDEDAIRSKLSLSYISSLVK